MNKDLIKLIKDALIHMGCPLSVMSKMDADSPIVFSFKNGIDMNLSAIDDNVWLWSALDEYSDKLIEQNAAKFLKQIMEPYPFFTTGKMHLANEDGQLVLQGLVREESMENPQYFAATLQIFFDTALRLHEIIQE